MPHREDRHMSQCTSTQIPHFCRLSFHISGCRASRLSTMHFDGDTRMPTPACEAASIRCMQLQRDVSLSQYTSHHHTAMTYSNTTTAYSNGKHTAMASNTASIVPPLPKAAAVSASSVARQPKVLNHKGGMKVSSVIRTKLSKQKVTKRWDLFRCMWK